MIKPPIFIVGRFRSGTSFLWQLFNQLSGYRAWYEPLHPQLLSAINHVEPKQDHVGISDYWQSYREKPEFETAYSMQFATQQLYLEAEDEFPELEVYIKKLIELSASDTPVLQFNRCDFRLPWLKAKFPEAIVIHIERNPLQLYYSQRKHIDLIHRDDANYWDAYELMPWCYALQKQFPFLLSTENKHAFYPFYFIYQLSRQLAKNQSDVTINLDNQVFQSDEFIGQLTQVVALSAAQIDQIKSMTHVPELPVFDEKLSDEWSRIMTAVDLKLTAAGLLDELGTIPLKTIKTKHPSFWRSYEGESASTADLLLNINQLNSELTRILAENNQLKEQLNLLQDKLAPTMGDDRNGQDQTKGEADE